MDMFISQNEMDCCQSIRDACTDATADASDKRAIVSEINV
jgi:hypothetical protein